MQQTPEELVRYYKKVKSDHETEKRGYETKKKSYEDDFTLLQDSESILGELGGMVSNDSQVATALSTSCESIREFGTSDNVPGFEPMFTAFNTDVDQMAEELTKASANVLNDFEDTGTDIDTAQTKIADLIADIDKKINLCDVQIDACQQLIDYYTSLC